MGARPGTDELRGTFAKAVDYVTGNSTRHADIGDLDGDGKPDLAAANYGANTVSLLVGKGDGTFAAAMNLMIAGSPSYTTIADVNNDKIPDLLVSQEGANSLTVLPGMGSLTFAMPRVFSCTLSNTTTVS